MPIQVACPQCAAKFSAPDAAAGKRVKCPKCTGPIVVPEAGQAPLKVPATAPAASAKVTTPVKATAPAKPTSAPLPGQPKPVQPAPVAAAPGHEPGWFMQTQDGEQYGPVSREELDMWFGEGRIDLDCQLLQEGDEQWKWANEVYPELDDQAQVEEAPEADPDNPFAAMNFGSAEDSGAVANPFQSPASSRSRAPAASEESDGTVPAAVYDALVGTRPWVMVFSILGFLGCASNLVMGAIFTLMAPPLGLMIVALAGMTGYAMYNLFNYSQKIGTFVRTSDLDVLGEALECQHQYWKWMGITMISGIVGIPLAIMLTGLLFGAVLSMMIPVPPPDMSNSP